MVTQRITQEAAEILASGLAKRVVARV